MDEMQVQIKELIKERNKVTEKLRSISSQKRKPENDILIVKCEGEDIKEFPHTKKKKRSRSPKKVDFQIEKPPSHVDPLSEKIRNKRFFSSVLSHLQQAKQSFSHQKESVQNKIDEKVSQEIRKVSEDIKTQTREELAVPNKQKIKESELKRKKELDEEILRLESKIQASIK